MKIILNEFHLETRRPIEVLDITSRITAVLESSDIADGLLTVLSKHTTAFVNINEREPELQRDMVDFLERLAPRQRGYRHDVDPVDDRPNAHAHLAGLLINTSESIPIVAGKLLLGEWQSILFVELDGPRERRSVQVHIMGEPRS